MKKLLTFNNFMVLLGIMAIFFYFIPAINIATRISTENASVNLFVATFGGKFSLHYPSGSQSYQLVASVGLIAGFFLGIAGILLSLIRTKIKFANLLAIPFYTAAGVLVLCAGPLVTYANNGTISFVFVYKMLGGAITVGVFFCILAFLALVDFIATVAKPKQAKNPAY